MQTNVPEFAVSQLAGAIKNTLENSYGRVRVRGELGRVTIPRSGHMYATIKDDGAAIDAVCWKGVLGGFSIRPEEGMEVICTGRVTTYPQRSNYQLVIEKMELAGQGAILAMLEARKKKLAAEGLFSEEKKQSIPFLPNIVGVITSPTGAVIKDIMHRLEGRFPRRLLLWPVVVQGDNAAGQITSAIKGFDAINGELRPDVLIVARGGGSIEDLMPFNDEAVVRATAECKIPLISAVGHETDTTLIDFASDRRAPTPTAAAEIAVPVRTELLAKVAQTSARLTSSASRLLSDKLQRIDSAKLGEPHRILEPRMQSLDILGQRFSHAYGAFLDKKTNSVQALVSKIVHPNRLILEASNNLERAVGSLIRCKTLVTKDCEQKLAHTARMLQSLSFQSVLDRGFTLIYDTKTGRPITDASSAKPAQNIQIQFRDDKKLSAVISGATKKQKQTPPKQCGFFDDNQ